MKDSPDRDVAVFIEALQLPPENRAAYLDRACANDVELRQKVEALLRAHNQIGDFLEDTPHGISLVPRQRASAGEKPGDQIGRFKLLQQIGEGGCGIVFMAEQSEPVRRKVALKIIKPGMDTKNVIARFEAERQVLALMDSPNIAKIFEAGATESGRPYFVMELVRGIKITEYCDQHCLTTEERLKLFVQVCTAVQHAHQKGIIHRDIKPSNILVTTTVGGTALPVVIDFGIAKATTNQRLTDKTLFTAFEMLIGTPAYMSPEQAEMTSVDVDTRTDIYSLGVLLYELLTGTTPFDTEALLQSGLDEVRRVIRELEPARPSTRLSKMTRADLTAVAQHCKSEPPILIPAISGDLDWIAMKALEKDRTRRYETAYGMALDIQHYLSNEPVSARPPSRFYKLKKTILRNKFLFASIGIIALLLVTSLIVVSVSLSEQSQARRKAEAASAESQQITKFLENMLNGVGPSVALGRDTTMLREIVDNTAEDVGTELTNQPAIQAEMYGLMSGLYRQLGNYSKAEAEQRTALAISQKLFGAQSKEAAASLNDLGVTLMAENKLHEGEEVDHEALAIRLRLFGEENVDTATSINDLGALYRQDGRLAEAEAMARRALAIREKLFGKENLDVADSLRNLSIITGDETNWDESETLAREVLAIRIKLLGRESPEVASALTDVAWAAGGQSNLDEAQTMEQEALAIRQKLLPPEHPEVAKSLYLVGNRMRQRGNINDAYPVLSAALSIQRKVLSPDDPDLLYTLNSLGLVLENENRWPEAESVWREALDGWRKRAGDGDMKTEYAMYNLTLSLEAQNKWPEAETLRRSELTSLRKRVGNDDPQTLYAMGHLASVLSSEEKWPEAESLYREELAGWRKLNGSEDKETLETLDSLLSVLGSEKKWADAETVLRDEWSRRRKQFGDDDPNTLYAWRKVGLILEEEGKWADAETVWSESLAPWRKQEGDVGGQQSMYTLRKLGLALEAEDKWPEAETVFREALTISRKQGGDEGDEAIADLERLASVLMPQKKFADTQNLLEEVLTPAFARQKTGQDLILTWVNMMGRCGQWPEATTDAVLLVQYLPADHYNYHRLAGLLAMTQNRPAYEKVCQEFVTIFTNTIADPYVDERMVQDCLLLPHSGVDLQLIDNRADAAITFGKDNDAIPYFQACKAMSEYRLGRYAAAIEWADKSEKSSQVNAEAKAYAISAMAHWQLGQKDIAQTMLAKGDALAPGISKTQGTVDLGESWVAWLIARVSLDEATALFQSGSTTNAASGQP